ncbi:MAG: hypothetical protein V5A52_08885 [Halovenus sp.]|uniref:hypothetical protein n=1 Tax=Halovenus amylolytica TaxID=2500550 RepID=UPI000FE3CA14
MLYDRLASLDLQIDDHTLALRERDTSSGFTRTTTIVSLHGDGETGHGEDVTYDNEPHYDLAESDPDIPITDTASFAEFSGTVADIDLFFGEEPGSSIFRNYRRWAFESAALDLALKQAGTNLGEQLNRSYSPVRFVVSTRLEEPPTGERVVEWLDRNPDLEFKLDPTPEWTPELVETLADTGAVQTLDLKGKYEGTDVDVPADPELYELIRDGFPDAIIEDPNLTDETQPIFEGHEDRVSWDYPIRSIETVEALPWEPGWLNIKPSRFGSVQSLLDTIEYCQKREIKLYGGGQFELGVGREQLHALASLFYPDAPNDVAPGGYNDPEPTDGLPQSPLPEPGGPDGFGWS